MRKSLRLKFTLLACLVGLPSIVRAECFEDRRTVTFDQGGNVQFRSYGCQVDGGSLRVEFHRIGALAASLLFADKTSAGLEKAIGRPRLIANEVSATFLSLLQQFGSATASKDKYIAFSAEAGGAGGSVDRVPDAVAWDSAKVFGGGGFYPAIEDGDALRAKIIPRGMKYFYSVACSDDNTDTSRPTCNNIDSNLTRIKFWRSMGESDVTDYSRRMRSYNARYMPQDFKLPLEIPPALQLVSYLADGRWPDDFVILVGSGFDDGCDSGFAYSMPVVMLEVALVENVSDRPLTIDSVSGGRAAESRLRLASASASNFLPPPELP